MPKLTPYEQGFYDNYHELGTERQIGMTVGPIPLSAIRDYADYHGYSRTQTAIMTRVIRAMDQAEFKERSRVAAAKSNK